MSIIRRRIEKVELLVPEQQPWRFNTRDLAKGYGPMSDQEKVFLESLTLQQSENLTRYLQDLPIDSLTEVANDLAIARLVLTWVRAWADAQPEGSSELQN